jgi:hypothetical protein
MTVQVPRALPWADESHPLGVSFRSNSGCCAELMLTLMRLGPGPEGETFYVLISAKRAV